MRPIHVLHVDDSPDFGELVSVFLEREGTDLSVTSVTSGPEGIDRLDDGSFDCVVSDYDMPRMDGLAFLREVRETFPDLPFILFTGKGSEEIASEAITAGVTDYLQKEGGTDQFTVLANRVENVVHRRRAEVGLEEQIGQQEAVATLSRRALDGDPLPSLFADAVGFVADRLGTDYAKLLERQPDGSFLLRAGVGWDEGLVGSAVVPGDDDSQAGYTLQRGAPVVVRDLTDDERFSGPPLLRDHGVTSGVSVVVGSPTDPWGVFGTHTVAPRTFGETEVTFVRTVANVLGAAIDRHRTEERLRASEARFREIAELSFDAIFRADRNGFLEYVSPASLDVVGHPPEAMVDTHFSDYIHESSLETAAEAYARVLGGETVRDLELTLVHADGSTVPGLVDARPVTEGETVTAVQGFVRPRNRSE